MLLKTLLRAGICAALLAPAATSVASAQELDSNTGDIIVVGFNFCPRGWVNAEGGLLPISQYSALFSLYGTTYGGDGRTTMGVPDFRGRSIVHFGSGPGLTTMPLGQRGGAWTRTLTSANLAPHTHAAIGSSADNNVPSPANAAFADFTNAPLSGYNAPANTAMEGDVISNAGGNQSFYTIGPSTVMKACVQPFGIYPTRP